MSSDLMAEISIAKFRYTQFKNHELVDILLATKDAQLFHLQTQRGNQSRLIHFHHLETIRNKLTGISM